MTGDWREVSFVQDGKFVGQGWIGTKGELPTMFTLTGSRSGEATLARSGANQGLGLSYLLGPVVCPLGSGSIQT